MTNTKPSRTAIHTPSHLGARLEAPQQVSESISAVVEGILAAPERLGQPGRAREPIPAALRRLVFMRDEFTCNWCGARVQPRELGQIRADDKGAPFQLDHIVPHAAGGCDHAHNLRVLCRDCNENRSNRATDSYARALPVTEECVPCHSSRGAAAEWDGGALAFPAGERLIAYCGACRLVSWVTDPGVLW